MQATNFILVSAAAVIATCAPVQALLCPHESSLKPSCRCSEYSFKGLLVTCQGIRNPHELEKPFMYLRDYDLYSLTLHTVNVSIPTHLFKDLNVVNIMIVNSTLRVQDFPSQSEANTTLFLGRKLNSFHVRHTDLDLGNARLGAMNSLQHVRVDTSTMKVLRRNWFCGLTDLKSLTIQSTRIDRVDNDAFSALDRVETINLPANRLDSLLRSYFPHLASELRILDFSDNRLTSLPTDMFDNMPVLETVLLSRNKFKTLSPAPWRPMLRQLVSIKLDGNPIDCSGNISWLLQSDVRHKISGTCLTPRHLAGINLYELNDTRYSR